VVSLFRDQAEQKGLDFRISIPDDFFPAVVVDGLRLSQILMNLLSNAIKFTPQGFVALSAEVEPGLATIVRCRFQVSDSGIGMSLEQQQNLFKPFSQGDSAITRKYGGTGLGLVISSRLAELMGGHLEVVSELGRGSIFSLDLELSLAKAADVVPTGPAGSFRDEAPLSGLKILLVEDNAINLQIARELLQSRGASVVTASSGQSALAQAPDQDFDVVLMDLYMPDMDGYQTAAALRQLPGWGGIPIVALSASVLSEDREKALKSGLRAFLPKPLDPELTVTTLINLTRKGMRHDET
jgi:CheY-like chemotaxis protein